MAEVTPHDREQALAELERIAYTLTQMSQWLGSAGEQRSAVMLEEAWKNVVAAGWLIQRQPARAAVPAYHRPPAALEGPKHRRAAAAIDGHGPRHGR
jgi:hypothetical protein